MRILGIDYGDARTGLSISDPSGFLAGSPSVIHEWNYANRAVHILRVAEDDLLDLVFLNEGHQLVHQLGVIPLMDDARRTGLHVVLWDERRTTVAAHEILHRSGKKEKKHRQSVDAVAATLILQGYLDFKRRQ